MLTSTNGRDRLMNVLLMVLLAGAIVEVALLVRQNRSLRAQLESLSSQAAEAGRTGGPEVGSQAAPLDLIDPNGAPARLVFGGQPRRTTLVMIATAECPACAQTLTLWKKALVEAPSESVRSIALTLEDPAPLEAKLQKAGLSSPVYKVAPGEASTRSWKIKVVPLTVVVDPSGKIDRVWEGTFSDEAFQSLRKALR